MKISDVDIYCPDGQFRHGSITCSGGVIRSLDFDGAETARKGRRRTHLLVPGFIDIHVHGSCGRDFLEGTGALKEASGCMTANGVTTFLPTFAAAPRELLVRALSSLPGAQAMGAEAHSFHLEGPFINPLQKGAQNPAFMRMPDIDELEGYMKRSRGRVSLVTVAPELEGSERLIRYCTENGIRTSIGHTLAPYETAVRSFDWGVTISNHTYNAMGLFHHRKPGTVGAVLVSDSVYCELIADGVHVSEGGIRLLLRSKSPDRIILVTDAIMAQNAGDGRYRGDAFSFTVDKGVARLDDGTLAGSTLTMDRALRNMCSLASIDVETAIPMLTSNPAEALGLTDRGQIAVGKRADLVLLDRQMRVTETYCAGRKTFSA
ncbi:MAG: N-acetylglucosamine-6-phosphate deacetylase [Thermoplasmata archaeon]|nr:N-acetylglucosamine-6-phosphate deacetylase [Candidatus Sysuiplasma acidicola]MBX8646796.1 N-acetylglucosamine-6-phosphate deacetylase [Candidatus Sysuiplasma acidicola]